MKMLMKMIIPRLSVRHPPLLSMCRRSFYGSFYRQNPIPRNATKLFDAMLKKGPLPENETPPKELIKQFQLMLWMHPVPSISSFNKLFSALVDMNRNKDVVRLVDQMELRSPMKPNLITLSIVINALANLKYIDQGMSVLGRIIKFGYEPDLTTYNTLVKGFIRCDRIVEVAHLINRFEADVITYGIIIKAMCAQGENMKILSAILKDMEERAIKPDVVIYSTIISKLCKDAEYILAMSIFGTMIKLGIDADVITCNTLVDGAMKISELRDADKITRYMSEQRMCPNLITYTSIIDGYGKLGRVAEAQALFDAMISNGVKANVISYTALLDAYCLVGNIDKAEDIFLEMLREGAYNVDSFNSLINGYCKNKMQDKAIWLYCRMSRFNQVADTVTYNTLIDGLFKGRRVGDAEEVLGRMRAEGVPLDVRTYAILVHGYCENQLIDRATQLVDMIKEKDMNVVVWSNLIEGLYKAGKIKAAGDTLKRMVASGVEPDLRLLSIQIKGLFDNGQVEEARQWYMEMLKMGIEFDAGLYNIIAQGLMRNNQLSSAVPILREMAKRRFKIDASTLEIIYDIVLMIKNRNAPVDPDFLALVTSKEAEPEQAKRMREEEEDRVKKSKK